MQLEWELVASQQVVGAVQQLNFGGGGGDPGPVKEPTREANQCA